jgi:cysteine desulfurase
MSIYLDNSLAARPSQSSVDAMIPYLREGWGNSSAPHTIGQRLERPIKRAYEQIYQLLGADVEDTVILTGSGAEAVNQVLHSVHQEQKERNHFVAANTDEAATLMALGRLEQSGATSTLAKVNENGIVTVEALGDAITSRTALFSISWADGLTGVIQPVEELAALCKERGILFHLDATHVLGKLPVNLQAIGADYITFHGEQLHGPQGSGGLCAKQGSPLRPFICGSQDQAGLRAGGLPIATLVALGEAAAEAEKSLDTVSMEGARLRGLLEELLPDAIVFHSEVKRLPTISCMGFPGVVSEALLHALDQRRIYASFGGGSFQRISLILEAAGVDRTLAQSALSFSLSRETTEEEVQSAAKIITDIYEILRRGSFHLVQTPVRNP